MSQDKTPNQLTTWDGSKGSVYHVATERDIRKVRIMTTAEGYAMVRIKGYTPFVVDEKDLRSLKQL